MATGFKAYNTSVTELLGDPQVISDVEDSDSDSDVENETNQEQIPAVANAREPHLCQPTSEQHPSTEGASASEGAPKPAVPPPSLFPFTPALHNRNVLPPKFVEETNMSEDENELLLVHQRLGHLPYSKIKNLAAHNVLPRRLIKCREPRCAECLFGKQTRRKWRDAKNDLNKIKTVTEPGACVSVDQLLSRTPGLVAQGSGTLMNARYTVATIFVDHATKFGYVHLQKTSSGDETLDAKKEFERIAASYGVRVLHYHADNGRFAEKKFMQAVRDANQTITFCGVGAHHQNGVAEKRIRDLTEHARTMLIHAAHRWPRVVNAYLWPYALRLANHLRNQVPVSEGADSPVQLFSKVQDQHALRLKQEHPFGCPVFVLAETLQGQKMAKKWSERSRIGVYLGHSPHHATSVAWVLNITTGHVSPQFHVVFDDHFDTALQTNKQEISSLWQDLAKLTDEPDPDNPDNDYAGTDVHRIPRGFRAP